MTVAPGAAQPQPLDPLLAVQNLTLSLPGEAGAARGIEGLSFTLAPGEVLALVGPSGSGKSALALAILGLLRPPARVTGGEIAFAGRDLLRLPEREMCRLRGRKIGVMLQDPLLALNPLKKAGVPVAEAVRLHQGLRGRTLRARAVEHLAEAGLPDPAGVFARYPHELSGGMRQRVLLASALAGRPRLLIADEPASSLDAPLRRHVLALLREVSERSGTAVLLITHDLGEAALADRVLVLQGGRVVESGPARRVLSAPRHPLTAELRQAAQALTIGGEPAAVRRCEPISDQATPLLEVRDLRKHYVEGGLLAPRRVVRALDGVSLTLREGETLGIAGESGSGKSTLTRAALRLLAPSGGTILFRGEDVTRRPERELRPFRRAVQLVFQDPGASLDPRLRLLDAVAEPLAVQGWAAAERREWAIEALERVGLGRPAAERYPHELSVGQRQLACLARALAPRPALIALDEPVSSLDALSRHRVVSLLGNLRESLGLGYLIVSHDAAVLHQVAERVLVLFRGRVVEAAPTDEWRRQPLHPYSRYLLAATLPAIGPAATLPPVAAARDPWSTEPAGQADGCPYLPRCPWAQPRCHEEVPAPAPVGDDRLVACHFPG